MSEVRERLRTAAVELIAERGWTAVTTRTVAERAGVTAGLVHYHFGSVSALLTEAALEVVRGVADGLVAQFDRAGSLPAVTALVLEAAADIGGTDPVSLLFTETYLAAHRDDGLRRELGEVLVRLRAALATALSRYGVPDPAATAAVLIATVDGIALHRALALDLDGAALTPVLARLTSRGSGR